MFHRNRAPAALLVAASAAWSALADIVPPPVPVTVDYTARASTVAWVTHEIDPNNIWDEDLDVAEQTRTNDWASAYILNEGPGATWQAGGTVGGPGHAGRRLFEAVWGPHHINAAPYYGGVDYLATSLRITGTAAFGTSTEYPAGAPVPLEVITGEHPPVSPAWYRWSFTIDGHRLDAGSPGGTWTVEAGSTVDLELSLVLWTYSGGDPGGGVWVAIPEAPTLVTLAVVGLLLLRRG